MKIITALFLSLLLSACTGLPSSGSAVPANYQGCTGCGAEVGNSGAGTYYVGRDYVGWEQ